LNEVRKDLATAIAIQAIQQHHYRALFFSSIELVNLLEQEKHASKEGRLANRLLYTDLVILDELGFLPFSRLLKIGIKTTCFELG